MAVFTLLTTKGSYKDEQGTEKENSEIFKRLNGNATDLDFDSFGNLYVGGNGSLIDVVDIQDNDGLTSGVTQVVDLDSLDIVALRVFSGYLYILTNNASFDQKIYKLEILDSEGALGGLEFVLTGLYTAIINFQHYALRLIIKVTSTLVATQIIPHNGGRRNGSTGTLYPSILSSPPINYMSWGKFKLLVCY